MCIGAIKYNSSYIKYFIDKSYDTFIKMIYKNDI